MSFLQLTFPFTLFTIVRLSTSPRNPNSKPALQSLNRESPKHKNVFVFPIQSKIEQQTLHSNLSPKIEQQTLKLKSIWIALKLNNLPLNLNSSFKLDLNRELSRFSSFSHSFESRRVDLPRSLKQVTRDVWAFSQNEAKTHSSAVCGGDFWSGNRRWRLTSRLVRELNFCLIFIIVLYFSSQLLCYIFLLYYFLWIANSVCVWIKNWTKMHIEEFYTRCEIYIFYVSLNGTSDVKTYYLVFNYHITNLWFSARCGKWLITTVHTRCEMFFEQAPDVKC